MFPCHVVVGNDIAAVRRYDHIINAAPARDAMGRRLIIGRQKFRLVANPARAVPIKRTHAADFGDIVDPDLSLLLTAKKGDRIRNFGIRLQNARDFQRPGDLDFGAQPAYQMPEKAQVRARAAMTGKMNRRIVPSPSTKPEAASSWKGRARPRKAAAAAAALMPPAYCPGFPPSRAADRRAEILAKMVRRLY